VGPEPLSRAHSERRSAHAPEAQPFGVRLGLRMVRGLREEAARSVERARRDGPFRSLYDLWRRTRLMPADLARLAAADALASLLPAGASRREALWHIHALPTDEGDLFARTSPPPEESPPLPGLNERERVLADYQSTGVCIDAHPMELMRPALERSRVRTSRELAQLQPGLGVRIAGMAIVRQRPETAKGMFFMTLEDEHGFANLVVTPDVFARHRRVARQALFVIAHGKIERSGQVVNVKVDRLDEIRLGEGLAVATRDFH